MLQLPGWWRERGEEKGAERKSDPRWRCGTVLSDLQVVHKHRPAGPRAHCDDTTCKSIKDCIIIIIDYIILYYIILIILYSILFYSIILLNYYCYNGRHHRRRCRCSCPCMFLISCHFFKIHSLFYKNK